jgi:nucleoside-diphosphate-sugar epimerase
VNGGQQTVLVARGGGFIGGHIATRLSKRDVRVPGVDIKPLDERHQISSGVDAYQLDLPERERADAARHGRYVPQESEPLEGADALVIASNHSAFDDVLERPPGGTLLVDACNATGLGGVFGLVHERAVLG